MNYDSITGLPRKESFLAYCNRSLQEKPFSCFLVMALRFPILSQTGFLVKEQNRNYLLSSAVHKLIRSNHFIKTAFRMEDDTLITFIDQSVIPKKNMEDELQKLFSFFSEESSRTFTGIPVCIHAGLCLLEKNASIEACIEHALQALCSAAGSDFTRIIFYNSDCDEKKNFETAILPAIEENWKNNHVFVYLQPKFELQSMNLVSAEALVRIMDTRGHLVKPDFFLRSLEEHQLSGELDLTIMEKILRLLQSWYECGITPIPISINLSERTLYEPVFTDIFSQLVEKYQSVSRFLRIEISEASYLHNPYHINQMIAFFHNAGCLVELDDFGRNHTSYTSQTLPHADFVKLSPSFWSIAMQNMEQESIFEEALQLLYSHHIACIAECVEHESELNFLSRHEISFAQGFYFSRPVPFDIFQKKYLTYTFVPSFMR